MFYQCLLIQYPYREVAWIEERGARKGVRVEIKGLDGLWDVEEVYLPPRDKSWLQDNQKKVRQAFHSGDIVRGNK